MRKPMWGIAARPNPNARYSGTSQSSNHLYLRAKMQSFCGHHSCLLFFCGRGRTMVGFSRQAVLAPVAELSVENDNVISRNPPNKRLILLRHAKSSWKYVKFV
jgi:hypothetical protein